jgi:hypothetical protein
MKQIDLFTAVVDADEQHPNFKRVLEHTMAAERAQLAKWTEGFPDRDNKFVKEFQTTFNSSFWEIYLHALFKEYGFSFNWAVPSPDFHLLTSFGELIVEAATANAADGKIAEWEKNSPISQRVNQLDFTELNREAMIRLSNAITGKVRAYEQKYSKLDHVKRKPFVIAVAPFEQPDFQYQYDRPIRALLYDYYVDEAAYLKNPKMFPDGPPGVKLGVVKKDNGAEVPLGIFLDDQYSEISAILFSCMATWGKVDALAKDSKDFCVIHATWGGKPNGKPYSTANKRADHVEMLEAGLQVFHNPYAKYPLDPRVFRRSGVVQHYLSEEKSEWVYEEIDNCLHTRVVQTIRIRDQAEHAVVREVQ